jgi:ribonuclease R
MAFRLGDDVQVKLVEAVPSAGALRFEMLSPGRKLEGSAARRPKSLRGQRRLGGKRRHR